MPDSDIREFPPRGLTWFWFLNGSCEFEELCSQIQQFADGGGKAVVLHPRNGMLVPYGGDEWWELIRKLVDFIVECGMQPWLYDEDPYPSGNAGGILVAEQPEFQARTIERFEASNELKPGELFTFPIGKLCWAGLVPPVGSNETPIDLTTRAGVIRRHWDVAPWDSRWYYPTTPLYPCDRSSAHLVEWSVLVPEVPAGWKLVSFVARPYGKENPWGYFADTLNPAATQAFIDHTFEGYKRTLGERFGDTIPAIFTDESKFFSPTAYTPGLFEDFQKQFGYDLRPRLEHLFDTSQHPDLWRTRIDFRTWLGRRFESAWVKPIGDWCNANNIKLVGHISPEDDVSIQPMCIGNLHWLQPHMGLAGIDLIVPAVGDRAHRILNVGALSAVSSAQQQEMPGVMSETLGASGLDMTTDQSARILAWQIVSGVSTIVVHGAFESTLGLRLLDAPPDYGPHGPQWKGILDTDQGLRPFCEYLIESRQEASVALFWPITTAMGKSMGWEKEDNGYRAVFMDLAQACLESQVGLHLLDEHDLVNATFEDGKLKIGRACYERILLPPVEIIGQAAHQRLTELKAAGMPIQLFGECEPFVHSAEAVAPMTERPWEALPADDVYQWVASNLTSLVSIEAPDRAAIRCSIWNKQGKRVLYVMNLEPADQQVSIDGKPIELGGNTLLGFEQTAAGWEQFAAFDADSVTPNAPVPPSLELTDWQFRVEGEDWRALDRPQTVFELVEAWNNPTDLLPLELAGKTVPIGGGPVASSVEYRAVAQVDNVPAKATLKLEPTAQNGHMMLSLNGHDWDVTLDDLDPKAVSVDITAALAAGKNEILFHFVDPMPIDGVRWSPKIYI